MQRPVDTHERQGEARVLHVVPRATAGGAEAIVHTLVERLPEHGIDAHVAYFLGDPPPALGARAQSLQAASQRDPRIIPWLRHRFTRFASGGFPCIVHTHLGWPLYFVRLAAAGLPVHLVHTEHSTANVRRQAWLRPIERRAYRGLDVAFAVSEGAADALRGWLGVGTVTVEVVLNGARQWPAHQRQRRPGRLALVSVGSLTSHKGFDVAIEAVARVREVVTSYSIVGEGPERTALESLIARLGLQDIVSLVGWRDEVVAYLRAADAMLVPSRREGFGLAAIEGMSTGLPVIASRVPGLDDVLAGGEAAATLVPAGNVAAFAAALEDLSAVSSEAYARSAAQAVRHAQRFSIDAMVRTYAERYRALIERRALVPRG